ncbi:DUF6385 domain-containing protein, partial [Sporomusa ovata]|uniref:DUF6385 domain-containing protein n=1 Tax=Sporomusa ovata TaxID=2378 RepID=UPI001C6FCAE6
ADTALPISAATITPISASTALPISASAALPISATTITPISADTALPITTNGELLPVSVSLATTDVVFPSLTGITNGGPGFERQVLGLGQWTYGVVNASPSPNNAITYLQISPDGNNWIKDGATYTIAYNGTAALVAGVFLKYARVYYYAQDATNSAVTLNVFFQGNTVG